ncbi:PepSY domain-containing protein [Faunimonas sp. B44]|uniref:PepSY domain-containing protein n=1 Tax=Faunimonas sp. B44 TaxID=3461493 RepID=UPI0040449463
MALLVAALAAAPALAQGNPGKGRGGGPPIIQGPPGLGGGGPPGQLKRRAPDRGPAIPLGQIAPSIAPQGPPARQSAPAARQLPSGCLSQQQTSGYVRSQQVMSLSTALQRAGVNGQPVRAALCSRGGGFVYEVGVLGPGGQLRTLTIPAN